jgi:perosamine synthetase
MTFYPVAEPEIGKEEEANVVECIRSNWISSLGKFIGEFETSFSQKFHRQNALTVSNGTTALHKARHLRKRQRSMQAAELHHLG